MFFDFYFFYFFNGCFVTNYFSNCRETLLPNIPSIPRIAGKDLVALVTLPIMHFTVYPCLFMRSQNAIITP